MSHHCISIASMFVQTLVPNVLFQWNEEPLMEMATNKCTAMSRDYISFHLIKMKFDSMEMRLCWGWESIFIMLWMHLNKSPVNISFATNQSYQKEIWEEEEEKKKLSQLSSWCVVVQVFIPSFISVSFSHYAFVCIFQVEKLTSLKLMAV